MHIKTALLLLLLPAFLCSQDLQDSLIQTRKNTLLGLPVAYNTPETNWAFGLVGIYSFYTDKKQFNPTTRPSQFQLAMVYTLNQQLFFFMPYDVFTPGNNYRFNGQIGYYRYTYFYYGNGNNFENYGGELYSFTFARLQLNALKRFNKNTFFGLRYWMEDFTVTDVEEEGLLAEGNVPGAIGGLVSGIGPSLQIDSRDKIFFPREGQFIEASVIFNAPMLGSDFSFTKLTFNGSRYFSTSPKSVLAVNAYLEFNLGETPFSQMALLGGRRLRGYYEGRYRDKNLIVGQGEWRFPIWRRFKGTIFGGVGVVAERADVFSAKYLRPAFGAGLRYLALKERQIHVRFDLAWGQNSSGFYLTIGEAF